MLLEGGNGQSERGEDEAVAPQSCGCIPYGGFGGMVDGFGDEFASAFCAPILCGSRGKVDDDAAFFPDKPEADGIVFGKEVTALFGRLGNGHEGECPYQGADGFGGGVINKDVGHGSFVCSEARGGTRFAVCRFMRRFVRIGGLLFCRQPMLRRSIR